MVDMMEMAQHLRRQGATIQEIVDDAAAHFNRVNFLTPELALRNRRIDTFGINTMDDMPFKYMLDMGRADELMPRARRPTWSPSEKALKRVLRLLWGLPVDIINAIVQMLLPLRYHGALSERRRAANTPPRFFRPLHGPGY